VKDEIHTPSYGIGQDWCGVREPPHSSSFVAKRLDRIQRGGFSRGVIAEEDAYGAGEAAMIMMIGEITVSQPVKWPTISEPTGSCPGKRFCARGASIL
jgi:hypothetical protein